MGWVWEEEEWLEGMFYSLVIESNAMTDGFFFFGYQLKVYRAGERMVDRMEFEELALKSIDLSISPSVAHFRSTTVSDNEKAQSSVRTTPIVPIMCIDA